MGGRNPSSRGGNGANFETGFYGILFSSLRFQLPRLLCKESTHIYIEYPSHILPAVTTQFLERIDELTILVSRSHTMRCA